MEITREPLDFRDVCFDVTLPFEAVRVHVAHFAEDRALAPGAVVLAEDPCNVREGIRVAAVEEIPVVDRERSGERLFGRRAPFEDLFAPIHAHIVVHVAGVPHLAHRGVPIRIVRFGGFELGARVEVWPRIGAMFGQSLARPRGQALVAIVVVAEVDEIHGEFAANEQLFDEGRNVVAGLRAVLARFERQPCRGDLAEVQILAHVRDVLGLRLIAVSGVGGEPLGEEAMEEFLRRAGFEEARVD